MFDLAWTEMFVILLITLVVVGPKDLPKVMRTIGGLMHKARGFASDFQRGLDDIARESELAEMKKKADALRSATASPGEAMKKMVDPKGHLDTPSGPKKPSDPSADNGLGDGT